VFCVAIRWVRVSVHSPLCLTRRLIFWPIGGVFMFAENGYLTLESVDYSVFFAITVTRRVKGWTRFVEKYVTGRRKRFRPHKVYIFLIRITSRVYLAKSVCPYERWDLGNYKSYNTGIRHADSCAAQVWFSSNAQKPPKTVAPTVLMLE